ncbi:MFS general substrate transporter [Rostrohypoxylon terebratum]|nr:MFS general substrate transporter [Rostrohypoxylon terebratum]
MAKDVKNDKRNNAGSSSVLEERRSRSPRSEHEQTRRSSALKSTEEAPKQNKSRNDSPKSGTEADWVIYNSNLGEEQGDISSPRGRTGRSSRSSRVDEEKDDTPAEASQPRSSIRPSLDVVRFSFVLDRDQGIPANVLPLTDLENSIVGWDSQDDPKMPLNFSSARKWVIVWSLAAITFMSPFSSSVLAPAISYINHDFHNTNQQVGPFPVSIYLLGYATGPLFLAPLSEIFGRASILTFSNIFFCVWHIGCALSPSLAFLVAFRFAAGVGGSGCMTLGGAIIGDLFPIEKRGAALSIWALGPLVGPTVGPLIGAFIAGSIGWRWSFWVVLIPSAIITIILALFLPETNHKVLMKWKVKSLSKDLNRTDLKACYELNESRKVSQLNILSIGMLRPLKMLIFAPMILIQSLYVSFIYGSVYLMYNSIPPTFETRYGWSTGVSGLVFISIGLGYMAGLWAFSLLSDRTVVRLTNSNGGVFNPEFRLTIMIWYSSLCPLSFFWYGWSAQFKTHWIIPVLGLFPLGFGVIGVFMPTQAYIIDAYPAYAASGIAAFTVLRSVIAAFLPICGPALFGNLGVGWGSSVLGFVGLAMIPIPAIIFKFGARIRERYPVTL